MKSILISSTRQWNCGDEFIWFGVRRVLQAAGVRASWVLWNRHPNVHPRPRLYARKLWKTYLQPAYDNSFYLDVDGAIDYVVFAGSPEWAAGNKVDPVLEYIVRNGIRASFIGVGAVGSVPEISDLLATVLGAHTDLIVTRDANALEAVRRFPRAHQDVCPALFSAPPDRVRKREKLGRLGIVIQATRTPWQSIPEGVEAALRPQFDQLAGKYEVEYVAHYVDDWKFAHERGIEGRTHYSSFSEDYVDIYDRFDAVVSTRVHGAGMAASLGIPSIVVNHDGRGVTGEGFLAPVASHRANLVEAVAHIDVSTRSAELLEHRRTAFDRHVARFRENGAVALFG